MAIQPVSDIILDVAMAADPSKASAAKQKLADAAGMEAAGFDALVGSRSEASAPHWSEEARSRFFSAQTGPSVTKGAGGVDDAKRGLETLIAKMMVESMLPKDGGATFGKGSAGGIWRSMLSDKLADELTRGKGLGITQGMSLTRGQA